MKYHYRIVEEAWRTKTVFTVQFSVCKSGPYNDIGGRNAFHSYEEALEAIQYHAYTVAPKTKVMHYIDPETIK